MTLVFKKLLINRMEGSITHYLIAHRRACNPTSPIEGLTDTSHHINRLLGIRYYAQNNYALGELNSLAVGSVTT